MDASLRQRVVRIRLTCDVMKGTLATDGYEQKTQVSYEQAAGKAMCLDMPHGACRESILYSASLSHRENDIEVAWNLFY